MVTINKLDVTKNNLIISYKGTIKPPQKIDKMIMNYYGQWSIYDAKFGLPAYKGCLNDYYNKITHLAYGFMGFNNKGDIGTWDAWADFGTVTTKARLYGDDFMKVLKQNMTINNYSGLQPNWYVPSFPFEKTDTSTFQFFRLAYAKFLKPDLKIIMSFGGWEYAAAYKDTTWNVNEPPAKVFYDICTDDNKFNKFVNSIVDVVTNFKIMMIYSKNSNKYQPIFNYGNKYKDIKLLKGYSIEKIYNLFDGVDIDWEYPTGCDQCASCTSVNVDSVCSKGWVPNDVTKSLDAYAKLLNTLKNKLNNPNYHVSSTIGGSPEGINTLIKNTNVVNAYNKIDAISIMTYDFMNGNKYLTHDSPLYKQKILNDNKLVEWNGDAAVKNMITKVKKTNINIGIPFYGRFQYANLSNFNGNLTQSNINTLFKGDYPAIYTACEQQKGYGKCAWVNNGEIGLNSINYQAVDNTSQKICDTTTENGCSFVKIQDQFYSFNDTNVGSTFYVSKKKMSTGKNSGKYIILSMPSKFSIDNKITYIKDNGLNGVITWMTANDSDFTLTGYVNDAMRGIGGVKSYRREN